MVNFFNLENLRKSFKVDFIMIRASQNNLFARHLANVANITTVNISIKSYSQEDMCKM